MPCKNLASVRVILRNSSIWLLRLLFLLSVVSWTKQDTSASWAQGVVPQNDQACFAPDEPCADLLAQFILSAKKSVDIAIYDINEDQVVNSLLAQARRVRVRVVVDRIQSKGSHSAVPLLLKAGVSLRYGRQRGIMHNKFIIVDGQRIELGSFNFTHHAAAANQENQLYLATPSVVSRYRSRFEKIWGSAKLP